MKIGIIGGTGFIGSNLAFYLDSLGYEVIIFSRKLKNASLEKNKKIKFVQMFTAKSDFFEGLDVLVNLAGKSILSKRWSKSFKEELVSSRVNQTESVVNAILKCKNPPKKLLNASAIGFYGSFSSKTEKLDEDSSVGSDFLSNLSYSWEKSVLDMELIPASVLRIGIVLSKKGGALSQMLPIFKMGLGGVIGSGNQMMSWIHIDDIIKSIEFIIKSKNQEKVYNLTAPNSVSNLEFSKKLSKSLFRPCLFPVPSFALKILYGQGSEVLLKGQNIYPKNLVNQGYKFSYNLIDEAFKSFFN